MDDIRVTPLKPQLGGEVHDLDLSRPLTEAQCRQIETALGKLGVLLFRGQDITPLQHIDFSRRFGELDIHVLDQYQCPGHPEVFVISNVVETGKHIGAHGGAKLFHSDLSYNPEPSIGSLFLCRECPPEGGQTEFAGMFAAYDRLPEARRQWLLKQRAVHGYVYHYETHPSPIARR